MDKFNGEAARLDHIAGFVGNQLDFVSQSMLFQFQLNQTDGHSGSVNGTIDLPHHIGNGADVILVAVGNKQSPQFFLVGHQVGKIGDHQIHAVHILLGETNAAVYHNHVFPVFQDGDVFSDLIQTAQRDNFQFFSQIKYSFQFISATSRQPMFRNPALSRLLPKKRLQSLRYVSFLMPGSAHPGAIHCSITQKYEKVYHYFEMDFYGFPGKVVAGFGWICYNSGYSMATCGLLLTFSTLAENLTLPKGGEER